MIQIVAALLLWEGVRGCLSDAKGRERETCLSVRVESGLKGGSYWEMDIIVLDGGWFGKDVGYMLAALLDRSGLQCRRRPRGCGRVHHVVAPSTHTSSEDS